MKIIVKLLLVPAMVVCFLTWVAGAVGLYRALALGGSGRWVEASASFGANSALLVGLVVVFLRLRVSMRRERRVFGSRTMRLRNVGASPRIALF